MRSIGYACQSKYKDLTAKKTAEAVVVEIEVVVINFNIIELSMD